MLIAFWVYLFIASNIFSEIIFGLKNILWPEVSQTVGQSGLTDEEIDALFSNEVQIETSQSGENTESTISWEQESDVEDQSTSSGSESE